MVSEDSDYEGFFKVNDVEFMGDNSKVNDLEVMGDNSKKKKKKKKVVEGAPLYDDFDNVNRFIKFLEIFYDVMIKLSEFCFDKIHGRGSTKSSIMRDKVKKTLQELFDYHMNLKGHEDSSKSSTNQLNDSWEDDYEKYMQDGAEGGTGKSELDVYLVDARERKSEGEPEEYLQLEKLEHDELKVTGKSFEHLNIDDT
ncbi:hypothetical protein POM88_021768 [Heracleum sosnowskyi]|uniref:Uncharacterized protein n=1 Tax=Heracleum sosnowskyi TaxID=360622 RepID=A0AAD8MU45_9APIA|nr:hypothetical protein POM88_021768 [Heracleum sosnowskyi]